MLLCARRSHDQPKKETTYPLCEQPFDIARGRQRKAGNTDTRRLFLHC